MFHSSLLPRSFQMFFSLIAFVLLLVSPTQLQATDKHDAYDLSIEVGRVDGKRVELAFSLRALDPKAFPLPRSIDQLQLKFFGVNGAVVYSEKLYDMLLNKPQKHTVVWKMKIKAYEPYGSVDAKVMFTSPDGTVNTGATAYISGYRLLTIAERDMTGRVALTVTLSSSDYKSSPIPRSLDKLQLKIFDSFGEVSAVENFTDVYLMVDKRRSTGRAVLYLDPLFKGAGTYEATTHIKPVQRTLIFSDTGDLCFGKCVDYIIIEPIKPMEEKPIEGSLKKDMNSGLARRQLPAKYALSAYPNPFNPTTTVRFELPELQTVNLTVYDILGKQVNVLLANALLTGSHTVRWDGLDFSGRQVPTGVYILRIQTENYAKAMRLLLLK